MHVLFVIGSLVYGGAETQAMALARALTTRGHRVTIYSVTGSVPRLAELEGSGVDVVVGGLRFEFDPKVIFGLRRFIRDNAVKAVQGFLFVGDFYSRLGCLGLPVPLLNAERNWNYSFPLIQRIGHRLTRFRVDGLVANTQKGLRFAAGRYRLPEARLFTVWNGLDIPATDLRVARSAGRFREEFFGDGDVRLACFAGSLKRKKDLMLALDVADRLVGTDDSWRVVFLGGKIDGIDGGYAEQVLQKHAALPGRERIRFAGNRADGLEIIAGSDVLFSTSVAEGFPNVVLEAMAVRTPVVSTDYSDISLILDAGQIEPTRDPDAYLARLLRVVGDANAVVERQRRFVETHCDINKIAAEYEAIYEKSLTWR